MTTLTLSRLRGLPLPRIAPATRIAAGLIALIILFSSVDRSESAAN